MDFEMKQAQTHPNIFTYIYWRQYNQELKLIDFNHWQTANAKCKKNEKRKKQKIIIVMNTQFRM